MTIYVLTLVLTGGIILIAATLAGALIVHTTEQRRNTLALERVKWGRGECRSAAARVLGLTAFPRFAGS